MDDPSTLATWPLPPVPPRPPDVRRATRRRRAVSRLAVGAAVLAAVTAGAITGVVSLLRLTTEDHVEPRCAAALDGTQWYLEPDQAETVALLAGLAEQRALPARALTIAIATGMQESKLRNIDHGDSDSLGVFQQRPSQGWGSSEQILDPVFSTTAFYDALVKVHGYEDMEITAAAQAVQRSAFPEAYGQHEALARAWASAMYGYSAAGAVACTLDDPEGPGDPSALADRALRDLGIPATTTETGVVLDAGPLVAASGEIEHAGQALANWAVAVAQPMRIVSVEHADLVWRRETGGWEPTQTGASGLPAGTVLVVLAT
jgi:hypothetical protein